MPIDYTVYGAEGQGVSGVNETSLQKARDPLRFIFPKNMASNKDTARRLVNLIQQNDIDLHDAIAYATLKIHQPEVSDDEQSKRRYFNDIQINGHVEIARVLEDGPYVALHFRVTAHGKSTINFHVYRFDNAGKLVEIWANTQDELPARTDGTTMLNGATEITDLDKTEQNRALTNAIYRVQVNGPAEQLPSFFIDGKMIQHNVVMGNDLSGMGAFLQKLADEGRTEKINSYELCVCEGNFSVTATHANFGPESMAFFDMQRWENGKVVEHWDVVAPLPSPTDWKNSWGKFNFFSK
ncbi:nuclear transport factor 2 family protein [soil metagenome]